MPKDLPKSIVAAISLFLFLGAILVFNIVGVLIFTNSSGKKVNAAAITMFPTNGAINVGVCNADGKSVVVTFNWSPQVQNGLFLPKAQYLDISTNGGADWMGTNVGVGTSTWKLPNVPSNAKITWRINTLNGLNNAWYPSPNWVFTTKNCQTLACRADVNHDGTVTAVDAQLVFAAFKTGKYDKNYDVDGNGVVSASDAQLAYSAIGQKCPTNTVSYNLTQPTMLSANAWAFYFSPVGGSGLTLTIKGVNGQTVTNIPVPSGQNTVIWKDAQPGTYSAVLTYFGAAVSNIVTFSSPIIAPSPFPSPGIDPPSPFPSPTPSPIVFPLASPSPNLTPTQ